jgi:predicted enzyme related to lactoylglutathione lyase
MRLFATHDFLEEHLMLNLNSLMVGSMQPKVMAEFYEKVFARPADMVENGSDHGWSVGNTFFMVTAHSDIKGMAKEPSRMILNFETEQVKEEFKRIKAIGAKVIKEPYEMEGMTIATFADPDGNYFQLMTPFDGGTGQ